ncbi:MAG: hypothetical protein WEB33_10675, partial [Bacteroidota bacterium]
MRRTFFTSLLGIFLFAGVASGQTGEWNVSAVVRGLLTTSSKIYPNPNSPSFDLRIATTPFTSVTGFGGEVRLQRFATSYFLYLSVEYLSQIRSDQRIVGSVNPPRRVPVDEGYRMIPIELGAHVYVPIGSQSWRLSMGGGVGAYHTERVYTVAEVPAQPVGNKFGFGIHVSINTEYLIFPKAFLAAGIKFRDPEVDVRNKFEKASTTYNNSTVP